jgi:hypothetical protein
MLSQHLSPTSSSHPWIRTLWCFPTMMTGVFQCLAALHGCTKCLKRDARERRMLHNFCTGWVPSEPLRSSRQRKAPALPVVMEVTTWHVQLWRCQHGVYKHCPASFGLRSWYSLDSIMHKSHWTCMLGPALHLPARQAHY